MKIDSCQLIKMDLHVGAWTVQPQVNRVSAKGRTLFLEPKVMEVLACLALHAGEVVCQDQLMKAVWPDTFVTQDSLKRCVSVLRRALDDDPQHPQIIETVRKRGYRIVAPVQRQLPAQSEVRYTTGADGVSVDAYHSLLSYFLMIGALLELDMRSTDPRDGIRFSLPGVQ